MIVEAEGNSITSSVRQEMGYGVGDVGLYAIRANISQEHTKAKESGVTDI